jgi:HK97 family phage portal protein
LLQNPNPWLTPWELWYLTVVSLELTGNSFWYAAKGEGQSPGELWVVPTPWVKIVADEADFVAAYEVAAPGGPTVRFAPGEIIHLKYPNPLDPHYGLSPLQANALSVDANAELLKSRHQMFASGQRPGMVFQTQQILNDQTVRRLEEKLQSKFGGRENWQRPLVLEQGLTATPWTLKPAEMDFLNSCKLSRDEIFALYRVPPAVAGVMENAGLGAEIWHGARAVFCEATVQPKLELIAQCLTKDLARRYGPDVTIAFADCSPRAADRAREQEERDIKLGVRTINEVRSARGLVPYQDPAYDLPLAESN